MPLKEKNKIMPRILFSLVVFQLLFSGCGGSGKEGENSATNDSLSKVHQRAHNDSLKQKNPLLILPPDSDYTGDYIDKYPNGVIKFKGQYRFGQRHGQWLSFFPNGTAWSEMQYDKGLREGPNVVYTEKGTLLYQGFYKNDQQDSIWCYYDTTGTIAKRVLFKQDRVVKYLPLK